MNVKGVVSGGAQAIAAGGAVRRFTKARREGDKLRMLDAVISILAVATAVAILIRELREAQAQDEGEQ